MKTFKQFCEQISQPGISTPTNDPQSKLIRNAQRKLNDLMRRKLQQDNRNLNAAQSMREEISPASTRHAERVQQAKARAEAKRAENAENQEQLRAQRRRSQFAVINAKREREERIREILQAQ